MQDKGAALLLDGHAELVARAGADGAHLAGIDAFSAALAALKPERIAGCGGLDSRHDAMLAAEAGADYVMFGEPDDDRHAARRSMPIVERVAWWAEVFEVPCVGFAASLDEVEPLGGGGRRLRRARRLRLGRRARLRGSGCRRGTAARDRGDRRMSVARASPRACWRPS